MKENMEYIKVEGTLKSKGEREVYDKDRNIYGYDNVTIVDSKGQEIFYNWMGVPVRLDAAIESDAPDTFYILQSTGAQGDKTALLYAAKSGEKKMFYQDGAVDGLAMFGLAQSLRTKFVKGSGGAVGVVTVSLISGIAIGVITGVAPLGLLAVAGTFVFVMWPSFRRKSRVNLDEAFQELRSDGFHVD